MIPDPDAVKPEGWLDDGPEEVPDPDASKPEDWSAEIKINKVTSNVRMVLFSKLLRVAIGTKKKMVNGKHP